jgi:glycosyltransferase involved in cell wall biosynthesis
MMGDRTLRGAGALPLVSVVIPSLNRAGFLVPTIDSILQQDYPRIECIVVDGGSTDETVEILRRYDGKLKWVSEPDSGPPDAINKGWRMSRGEILAWLNADDMWAPGAVSAAISHFMENSEADVVYGDCGIIDQDGRHISTAHVREWDLERAVEYCDHTIHQAGSFIRRSTLERVGWLWPRLGHDHELWLRISLTGGLLHRIPGLLAYARHHDGNLGYRPDIVIPLKLGITENFFLNPSLPPRLQKLRARAISNSYLKCVDYVYLGRFRWFRDLPKALNLLYQAIRADRSNGVRVLRYLLRLHDVLVALILKRYLPDPLYQDLRAGKRWLAEKLFRDFSLAKETVGSRKTPTQ